MEELTWTERREASFLKVSEASWPQAPNDSKTRGMQLQPSSAQILEFACIFRCSVAKAACRACCVYGFGNYVRLTKQPSNQKHCIFFLKRRSI